MRRKIPFYLCFTAILLLGLWLRGRDLAASAPSGDEGESSINGLTILQHGVPTGTYLGLPIFENCLTEPWPDSPEYEFRDSSYSKKNLAIYHGWLPLYAIALSQKLSGVAPDEPQTEPLSVRHSDAEVHRRVIAARAPAVVFGGFFMIFLFLAGRQMFGADAGMAAMLVGAVGRPFVYMAREARYHSATLTLTTAAVWAMWRVYRFGRWRDYLILAIVLVLLFYTHVLAFMIACAMVVPLVPAILRRDRTTPARGPAGSPDHRGEPGRPRPGLKLAALVALVAICIAPWILLTGFLQQRTHIPPAWKYLSFPADLIYYPIVRIPYLLLPLACFVWLVIVITFHERLPRALTRPLDRHHRQIAFLLAWIAVGILAFTFLVPAASYFYKRLTLPVMGPGVVWAAILFAAAARAWCRRWSMIVAPLAFLATVTAGNMSHLWFLEAPDVNEAYDMVVRLRALNIHPGTKLYCTPNHQLELQYMTGLPIQSVAPIRKSFLDSYPGPLVIIDSSPPYVLMSYDEIEQAVRGAGQRITREEIERYYPVLTTRAQRELLAPRVAWIWPSLDDRPLPCEPAVAEYQRKLTRENLADFENEGCNNPLLRGFHLRDWSDWWPIFFYRFVNPERRMGEQLNYADRVKSARTEVRPTAWAIYFCPPLPTPTSSTQPAR